MNTSTFKKIASQYKSCEAGNSIYLPIDAPDFSAKFNFIFEHNYNELLERIKAFSEQYLALENNDSINWLVRAYLELLTEDSSIKDDAEIFIYPGGCPCQKRDLLTKTDFYLFPFLLGIWHFIINHRQNKNHEGRTTFEKWHIQSGERTQWRFCSDIGCSITSDINVHLNCNEFNDNAEANDSIVTAIPYDEHQDKTSYSSNTHHQGATHTTNVIQIGEKNIHIDFVQNLNL